MTALLQWLVTPQGIPVLVALVGIISGVVGGGVSQVVAGLFKRQGDTRQLAAGRQQLEAIQRRWEEEQKFERQKLFIADLREACVKVLNQIDELLPIYWDKHLRRRPITEEELDEVWKTFSILKTEVKLLVPVMQVPLSGFTQSLQHLHDVVDGPHTETEFDEALADVELNQELLFDSMTVALGTYDVGKDTAIEKELSLLYEQHAAKNGLEAQDQKPHTQ